ncbi:Plasmodium vivax Vir protein, putative [Plasmodium vivax]|uniref:Vir protein, putative n=1 Tax=Plasmodium vivax TaxID=5855 RepID=A0A1G4HB69_PLAVI|nr:Plasmodium vivax Vir protein, putative [Plasmodium vivax]
MNEDSFDPYFKKILEEDDILHKIPLYSFYSILDKKYSENDSYEICKEQIKSYDGAKKRDILSFCRHLESIFLDWDSAWSSFFQSGNTKSCDSLNYWFHNKIKDSQFSTNDIEFLHKSWEKIIKEKSIRSKCNVKRHINSSTEELKNNKKLYDFLLYYKRIKEALQASKPSKKDKYCSYLWAIFSLYVKMNHDNTLKSGVYSEEIEKFKNIFINGDNELVLLKQECPGRCLDLLLNSQNTNVCSLEENNYIKYLPENVWLEDTTKKISKLFLQETTRENEPLKSRFVKAVFDNDEFKYRSTLNKFYTHLDLSVYTCDHPENTSSESNKNNTQKHTCKVKRINEIAPYIGPICNFYGINYNKCSEYLLYWLYGVIEESNFTNFQIHDVLNEMKILKENNKCFKGGKKKCIENFKIVFNTHVLRNKKLLHDFTEHYDNIKNILNDAKHTNKEIYCEYVKHYFELYKKMKKESPLDLTEHYREEIKNFEGKFNKDSLSFLEGKCSKNGIKSLFEAANVTRGPLKQMSKEFIEPTIEPLENEGEIKENILKGLPSNSIYEEFNKTDNEKKYISNNKDKLEENRCSYLIYWAGDQLRSIFSDSSKYNNFRADLNEINKILLSTNNNAEAGKSCYFYLDGNFSQWDEEKYLHDYFKNHGNIKDKYYSGKTAKNLYCDYLDYVKKLYEKYIWNCCRYFYRGKPWNLCPRYFECDKVYNPFELLSKFKCGSEIKDKNELAGESVQRIYEALTIDRDIIIQSQVKTHNKFLFDPFNKFVTASFTILGTLSVLFVLYKFTPTGIWFNKKVLKKRNHNYLAAEELRLQLADNPSVPRRSNANRKRIALAYQSA